LEISRLKVAWEQVRNAAVVVYSVAIMATIIPGFGHIPNPIVILYYFLVPGYFVVLLLRETGTVLDRLFYTVAWSIALFASIYAIQSVGYLYLPTHLIVPGVTIVLLAYDSLHKR